MTIPASGSPAQPLNTHNVTIGFGKHKGTLLTRVPPSYLRWMSNERGLDEHWRSLANAELDRRGHQLPQIELSGHAIDSASLRVRAIWHQTALSPEEGLYSWLMRITLEAIEKGSRDGDKICYLGMKLVVEQGEEFPVLKTIMAGNRRG